MAVRKKETRAGPHHEGLLIIQLLTPLLEFRLTEPATAPVQVVLFNSEPS